MIAPGVLFEELQLARRSRNCPSCRSWRRRLSLRLAEYGPAGPNDLSRSCCPATLLGTLLFTFVLFLRSIGQLFELLVRSSAPPSTVAYLFGLVLAAGAHLHACRSACWWACC